LQPEGVVNEIRRCVALPAALILAGAELVGSSPIDVRGAVSPPEGDGPPSFAAPAPNDDLDPSFGSGGTVIVDIGEGSEYGHAVALQPDGRILVGGTAESGAVLARLTASGAYDAAFGSGGLATVAGANDIALQADGKIVVAGAVSVLPGYCCKFAVARYEADGDPDTTFGDNGVAVLDFAYGANAVAIQPDGKIVAAGSKWGGGDAMAVARLNSDGSPDTTFGGDGTILATFDGWSEGEDVAIQPDGKIVVVGNAGSYNAPTSTDFALVRYNADGSLDTSFGDDGEVTTDIGEGASNYDHINYGRAVAIQADGRIVVGGDGVRAAVARYQADGSLDTSFGEDGIAMATRRMQYLNDLGIDPTGMIIVGGSGFSPQSGDLALARFDPDGWLDGLTVLDMGVDGSGGIEALGVQPDGRVVVTGTAGVSGSTTSEWVIARFASISPTKSLLATPTAVDFGQVTAGLAATAAVTITNPGSTAGVDIVSVTVAGEPSAGFSISSQGCPLDVLAPKDTCEIELQFAPLVGGAASAELVVESDASTSPLVVALTGTGVLPPSGVGWGTRYKAGPAYTWNSGNALGRTVQSGAQKLHLAYATPRIGSRWVKDAGPYLGVYYVRSGSGSTWSTPKRINPKSQHGDRVGLAAAGSRVYVTWVSQKKVIKYSPTAPRVLYVRVNAKHGAATKWKSTIRLTSKTGRVDFPTVAAAGADAYVAYTDAVTGSVKVAISHDKGATWKKRSLGTTTLSTKEGKAGWPSVAVSGSTVAVTWIAAKSGRILARVSTDRGATWSAAVEVGTQSNGGLSIAVRDTRIAVAWTTFHEVVLRQRLDGTWGDALVVASLDPLADPSPFGPAVALQDPERIAVTWSEENDNSDGWSDLRWAESANGGTIWYQSQALALATASSSRRGNDWPSVLWPAGGTRYIAWNGWTYNTTRYRLYLRKGTGEPVGPTVTAPVWRPDPDASESVTADRLERTVTDR
jgi:uncharacterized delta-60 repeat protein